ncbi:hypothetical protein J7E38_18750 [Bacillus sp. ISL-35]|uniref:hypothetical protein n=1 Tax=Bacillus sp. ISL-35 TaxID=2819122 RepID=UPI001BE63C37|nr:hypothetical protein [Bacillus sp. ISL-35]MBT2681034.1 hypothetical protein [Bacillus sp. ISL-35]MBT2705353.1 hypothetical protein [Chryseobacterium sp. ISL-80]
MNNNIQSEINKIDIPEGLSRRSELGIQMAKTEMSSKTKKRIVLAAPAIAAVIALSVAGSALFLENTPKNPEVQNIPASYAFDVTDQKQLVGWADNVFIGKVEETKGTSNEDGILETQYEVEVAENIKGQLNGRIMVNQQGGFEGNKLVLVENDQLLKEGESYLFVSRQNKQHGWHTIVPAYGDIMIENETQKEELIAIYKAAYENEVPFE